MTNTGPHVVTVANQKGGVGKTTTVMNLAAVAAASDQRVLVVDVDPQGSATSWATTARDRLPFDFADSRDPEILARLREVSDFDVIFVDTPGSLERQGILEAALRSSDFVLIPTEPAPLAVEPMLMTLRSVVIPSGIPFKVLLNKTDPRVPVQTEEAFALLDGVGAPHFKTAIRSYAAHTRAAIDGRVVTQYRGDASTQNARDDYRAAALELFASWRSR